MASSTDSHSISHATENLSRSISEDADSLFLKMTQAMEGKSSEERLAFLEKITNSLTKSRCTEGGDIKTLPDEVEHMNEKESLETLDKVNHGASSLENSAAASASTEVKDTYEDLTVKSENVPEKDQKPYKDANGTLKENHAVRDQEPHKNTYERTQEESLDGSDQLPRVHTNDIEKGHPSLANEEPFPHADINGAKKEQNFDLIDKEPSNDNEKEEELQGHEMSCNIPSVQEQKVDGIRNVIQNNGDSYKDADPRASDMKKENGNVEEVSMKTTDTVKFHTNRILDADDSKKKLSQFSGGKDDVGMRESSDDDIAPSTPASGGQSSGSDLSESPNERGQGKAANASITRSSVASFESKPPELSTASSPTFQHGGTASLPTYQHGGTASLPTYQHGGTASLPTYQHGGTASLPSYQHGGTASLPTYQLGSGATLPTYQYGGKASLPTYQHGSTASLPSYQHGSRPLPTYQDRGTTSLPTHQYGSTPLPTYQDRGTTSLPTHQYADEPHSQGLKQTGLTDEKSPNTSDLPFKTKEYGSLARDSPRSQTLWQSDLNNKTPSRTIDSPIRAHQYVSFGRENPWSPGLEHPEMLDVVQRTQKTSNEPIGTQGHSSFGTGHSRSPVEFSTGVQHPRIPRTSNEPIKPQNYSSFGSGHSRSPFELSTGLEQLGLNSTNRRAPPTEAPPMRTSEQITMTTTVTSTDDTSTVTIKPQNSLTTIDMLSSIPLYYQPHIVVQDQSPVLVLRPVLGQNSSTSPHVSSTESSSKSINLGSIPLIYPLGSANGFQGKNESGGPQLSLTVPSFANVSERNDPAKKGDKSEFYSFGAELVSGYASSVTESELDEEPLRKPPRTSRKQSDPARGSYHVPESRNANEYSTGRGSTMPYDWEFPASNPFVSDHNNSPITNTYDSLKSSYKMPSATSQYNMEGAPSKTTYKANPFAPEIPPRSDIVDLSRNDFSTIPKSMLASQGPPNGDTSTQREPESRVDTRPPRTRLSSDSMITWIESECEESPMDIETAVASHGTRNETPHQNKMFEPPSAPFFEGSLSTGFRSNSSVVALPRRQSDSTASMPRTPSTPVTVSEQPAKKPKPKLPGQVAPLWIPDDKIHECCYCRQKFTLIRRKHHCRGCGKIFCSNCCSQLARLSYLQYQIGRICINCTNLIKDAIRAKKNRRTQNGEENTKTALTTGNELRSGNQQLAGNPLQSANETSSTSYSPLSLPSPNKLGTGSTSQSSPPQVVYVPTTPGYQPKSITYTDPATGELVNAPIVYQPQETSIGQPGVQPGNTAPQNPPQGTIQARDSRNQPQGTTQIRDPRSQSQGATQALDPRSQSQSVQTRDTGSQSISAVSAERSETSKRTETVASDFKPPARPAGRIVSWRGGSFSNRLMLQDRRKALAKDLKELPHGVTIQLADGLQVIVKKIRVHKPQVATTGLSWYFCSNGLYPLGQTEIVILFEIKPKEDMFPEEVLRIFKVIFDLVKQGSSFNHGNFLAFNSPFFGSIDNAAFLFVDDVYTTKIPAIYEAKSKVLYGILVKRPELEITKFTPMRLLLRLGQETNIFPFPVVNSRDRAVVYDGIDAEDKMYQTCLAMNNYLKNSIPEALIPGLVLLKEDNKIVLQVALESHSTIVSLFDRLIVKTHQTATIPLSCDISPNASEYKVFHQSILTKEVSFGKSTSLFRKPGVRRLSGNHSVTGLGFLILHLGASSTAMENHAGQLVDDGVVVHLSKFHTKTLRQSLYEHSDCSFYLGDRFEVMHFELRWQQGQKQVQVTDNSFNTSQKAPRNEEFPGSATIDVKHSGHTSELKKLANIGVGDVSFLILSFEDRIRRVCMEPLMMQANKMRAGDAKELVLRVSLKEGVKKWSIGPSNQPMSLIRSLQMALHAVTLPELYNSCLELTFDVIITKQ